MLSLRNPQGYPLHCAMHSQVDHRCTGRLAMQPIATELKRSHFSSHPHFFNWFHSSPLVIGHCSELKRVARCHHVVPSQPAGISVALRDAFTSRSSMHGATSDATD